MKEKEKECREKREREFVSEQENVKAVCQRKFNFLRT